MRGGFRVARILGINIYIDWSWIFIFLLVTWNLAAAVFPTIHPDWNLRLTLMVSLAASLLFFVSVLIHELAHSVVAKAYGLPVRRITLFIFGGAADIGREPPSPKSEFFIAVVGPVSSLLLGVLFLAVGGLLTYGTQVFGAGFPIDTLGTLTPVSTLLFWLGPINILLGIFNMVPGFPLDGGRILRSILWGLTKNLKLATRWATLTGQAIAWMFILAGIAMVFGFQIPLFGTGLVGGLWLAFIGWFLNNAAAASYQHAVVQDMLDGVQVSRLMRANVPAISPEMPVSDLVYDYIIGSEEAAFPVLENDRLTGLVCLEDVRKTKREDWATTRAREIMTPVQELVVVRPGEDATDALDKLTRRNVQQIPVVEHGGQLVGMLRESDILRWLQLQSGVNGNGKRNGNGRSLR